MGGVMVAMEAKNYPAPDVNDIIIAMVI